MTWSGKLKTGDGQRTYRHWCQTAGGIMEKKLKQNSQMKDFTNPRINGGIMITVVENYRSKAKYRDFVEAIFSNRNDAEDYISKHPAKELCRLVELPFDKYPFALIEVGWDMQGNYNTQFIYLKDNDELFAYYKSLDIDKEIARQKGWIEKQGIAKYCDESDYNTFLLVNIISEQTISPEYNLDPMGGFDHFHIGVRDIQDDLARGRTDLVQTI